MIPLLLATTLFTVLTPIQPSYAHSAAVQPPQQRQTQHTIAQVDESNPPLTPREVQTVAEKITVRVTSDNNGGSGVLIAQKGSIYLVMTNKHVVGRDNQFKIQTPDGQKHTATLVPNTQIDPKYDIALLQFTSKQRYNLAQLENGSVLSQGREIYSLGYPFDSNRTRISIGKVTQLSDVPLDDGTQIGYKIDSKSPQIKQGMSGGPIVDGRGILLGINTIGSYPILPSYTYFDRSKPTAKLAAKYREANWGVPVYNLLTQLNPDLLYGYDNFPKVQRQVTPTGYMAKLNRETRQQTVRIEDSCGNGSGVIVAKQGNTYYALTAKHVVETPPQETKGCPPGRHKNIKLTTYDQDSYQITSTNITVAEGLDLGIVKFTSNTNYPVAKLGKYSPIGKATVFASGYPARDKIDSPLWQWQLNPGIVEEQEQGKFSTQDRQSFSNGYDLIYGSISYGGMSGGGVFDTEGNVIGIHGRAEQTNDVLLGKSLGISIQTFIGLGTRLGVPNSLKIITKPAKSLNSTDLETVIIVRNNILKPQNESSGEQWLTYGNQLYRIGKLPDAAVAFDRAITKGQKYQLLGNYGKALALAGVNNIQSLSAISTAISVVPVRDRAKYYYLWKYQSLIFKALDKDVDAMISIDIAIKLEPNDLLLLDQKAGIFSKRKQYLEAIYIYDLIISKRPEAGIYYNRGVVRSDLGQKQVAIADYDRAIAINPNFAQAYYNRGNAKSDLGQNQAAIADYDRAIAINPNFAQIYYNRGNVKSDLGQKQAAIADYDRAIVINPNLAAAYYNRGNAKYGLGQKWAAIADYDQAIVINPNLAQAYYNRGNAKYNLVQKQAAIIDLTKAAELFRQQGKMDLYEQTIKLIQKIRG